MRSLSFVLSTLLSAGAVSAAHLLKAREPNGQYIVKLREGSDFPSALTARSIVGDAEIVTEWDTVFRGFSVNASSVDIRTLLSNPNIESIEEEGKVRPFGLVTQTDAPWGLARLSTAEPFGNKSRFTSPDEVALNWRYTYKNGMKPVTAYIVDSGINLSHEDFAGRVRWGASFSPNTTQGDETGHGTHCAGILGGSRWGVAKNSQIVAVKIFDASTSGSDAWISTAISALEWVAKDFIAHGGPAVASFSWGTDKVTPALTAAAKKLVELGIHVVVAAGNSATQASYYTPGNVTEVITVGATFIDDEIATFSNFGPAVDIFAPGVYIMSASIESNNATFLESGTSMAAPHVAGVIAHLLGTGHAALTPAQMREKIIGMARVGKVKALPLDTVNLLLGNGLNTDPRPGL